MDEIYEAFEENEITPQQYKKADEITYKYFENLEKCNVINPTGTYINPEKRKHQLSCYVSSHQNTVCEIIQNYLYLPFKFLVLNDYYFNSNHIINLIVHELSKPDDMIGVIEYDPQEMSSNFIDGDELSIKDALDSKYFVFKYRNSYFHYDEVSLNKSLTNKDLWMYECLPVGNGEIDYNEELFIKLAGTASFLIPCNYLYSMFDSTKRLFEIVHSGRILEKTASFKNTKYGVAMSIPDHVSTNHCQGGSQIEVFKLVCEARRVKSIRRTRVKTNAKNNKNAKNNSKNNKNANNNAKNNKNANNNAKNNSKNNKNGTRRKGTTF